jgi:hypothetical protein
MATAALRIHQHRLAQPPPDVSKETAEGSRYSAWHRKHRLRQGRGLPASPRPRHQGHARPAAPPSGPRRENSSRRPTADQPQRHAAPLSDPKHP